MTTSIQELLMVQFHTCANLLRRSCGRHGGDEKDGRHSRSSPRGRAGKAHGPFEESEKRDHPGHGPHGGHGRHDAHRGQGRILTALRGNGECSQKDLAALLRVQPPSLSEALDKLEARGFVSRSRNDEDKRITNVAITETGLKQAEEIEAGRRTMAEPMFASLSQEEMEVLSALLTKLAASLEAVCDKPREGHGAGSRGLGRHGCHLGGGERRSYDGEPYENNPGN